MRVTFFFLAASTSCGLSEQLLTIRSLSASTPRCQQLALATAAFRLPRPCRGGVRFSRQPFLVRSSSLSSYWPIIAGRVRLAFFCNVSLSANNALPFFPPASMSPKNPYTLFYLRNCYQRPRLLCSTRCGIQNQSASHPFTLRCVEGSAFSN